MIKKGDIVVCVDNSGSETNLVKGKLYKVEEYNYYIYVEGIRGGFYHQRFKKIDRLDKLNRIL